MKSINQAAHAMPGVGTNPLHADHSPEKPSLRKRGRMLLQAFSSSRDDRHVRSLAEAYIQLARSNRLRKGYGNAIHQGYTILGLLELRRGDVRQAEAHLLASTDTPGSSQLWGMGPNMLLAENLLLQGRTSSVITYLDRCGKLWKLSFGRLWYWKRSIKNGFLPNFGANLSYLVDPRTFG